MRRLIAILLAMLMVLAVVSGCAKKEATPPAAEQPTDTGTTPAPEPKKEITVTIPYFPFDTFDHTFWTAAILPAQGFLFEGLYGYDENMNIVPKVAESATTADGGVTWTFKLRKDKKWANGDPVTAHDYYNAWVRFMSPDLKDAPMWAAFHQQVKGGWAFKGGAITKEELGVKLIDDYTLQVELNAPNPVLPNLMTAAGSMPIHSKTLADHPTDWWKPEFQAYNGPYVVAEWTQGGDTVFKKNPNYVGEGIGNVDTIILKPFADANARLQAFENGEIQFSFLDDTSQVEYVKKNAALASGYGEDVALGWSGIQFDRAADPGPWQDIRVRKAFAMAIDKAAIAEKVMKGRAVATTAFSGDPKITSQIKGIEYNVAEAQRLLKEAGYEGGRGFPEVMFYGPPATDGSMPMIEAIAKMWQDNLGVTVKIENNEWGPYSGIQWGSFNKNVLPGYTHLDGGLNWFEPIYLLQISDHIWYFFEYTAEWKKTRVHDWDARINDVANLTRAGDFAQLEQRAADAWAKRQQIVAGEPNAWGQDMMNEPTFEQNFAKIAERFKAAASDDDKLAAYKDALTLVLKEEKSQDEYANMTEANKAANRLLVPLRQASMEDAMQYVIPLQQMAVDTAWNVPIFVRKITYVKDPKLSGVVLNKLAWGNLFQMQYLRYEG